MYQLDAINMLRENLIGKKPSRELENTIYIYKSITDVQAAVDNCKPISAFLDKGGEVWIGHRPNDGSSGSRSAITTMKIHYNDEEGELVSGLCWCTPIQLDEDTPSLRYDTRRDLELSISQYVLLIPMLDKESEEYVNRYYSIGSRWTERVSSGTFEIPTLTKDIYNDWILKPMVEIDSDSDSDSNGSST